MWVRKEMIAMQITLEAARVNAGYTQAEAADLLDIHYQTLAKWEDDNSKMPYDKISKIEEIYKVPSKNIFFGKKNEFIRLLRGR